MPHASTAAYDRVWLADSPTVTAEYSWPLDEGHTEGRGRLNVATGPNITLQNGYSIPTATAATSIPRPIASPSPASIVELSSSPAAMFLSAFSPPCTDLPLEESTSAEDKEGDVIGGYVLGRVIGHGGNSIVRRASSPNGGNAVAVKIVRLGAQTRKARRELEKEEEIWSSLSHENVLPLFSSYHTATATFFVTPLCETGSLFDVLDRERQHHAGRQASGLLGLPPSEASPLFRQVISGLRYLHEQAGLVHRDMKLENVLVDEMGNCRISDFGTAKRIGVVEEEDSDDEGDAFEPAPIQRAISVSSSAPRLILARHRNSTTAAHPRSASAFHNIPKPVQRFQPGSLPYASPELLSTSPQPVGFAQDIWAVGVMLYALVIGQLPFVDGFEPRLNMKIRHAEIPYPESLPSGTLRVLKGCLDRNINSRWTVAQLDDEAWAVGGDVEPSSASMFVDPEVLAHDIGHPGAKDGRDRRSKSRARRSASRGPLTIGLGYSFTHPLSHPTTPHTGTPTSGYSSYQRLARSRQSSGNSHSPPSSASTSLSTSRGRERVKPDVYSRSASPSMAPATPIDELEVAVALERRGRKPRVTSSYEDFELALRDGDLDTEVKTPV